MVDKNNQLVVSPAFPDDLLAGYYEMAQAFLADVALASTQGGNFNISSVMADVVSVSFFRPESGSILPQEVSAFLAQFLDSGGASVLGGEVFGNDDVSSFSDGFGQLSDAFK